MAKKEETKYLTMMALVEKVRATCKRRLRETTDNNLSIFFSSFLDQDEFCIWLDHSSNEIFVSIDRPFLKIKRVFDLKHTDILVGANYIEFFESEWNFVHLDFDQYNITKEEESTKPNPKKRRNLKK